MKYLNFCLAFLLCIVSNSLFAQTPQQIEADLVKSYKKIEYYSLKNDYEKTSSANDEFETKLKTYTEKVSSTLTCPFVALKKSHVDISTSTDGLFRIYSWDTMTGGTMRAFENVFQYRSAEKLISILDRPKEEGDYIHNYYKIYTFINNAKAYYLTVYTDIGSTKDVADGIHVFVVDNGKLGDAKIIQTRSGLHNDLHYDYDFGSVVNTEYDKRPAPRFDEKTNTIYLPLIDGNRQMTSKFILYKFTGQYFERVKN